MGDRRHRAKSVTMSWGVRRGPLVLVGTLCALMLAPGGMAQERPLPDRDAFLNEARRHLQVDSTLQSSYVYVETRREAVLDGRGRVKRESVRVYESYPALPGEERWERLIAEDGRPVTDARLAAQDRERRRRAEALARRMTTQPAREHDRQQREYTKQRREFDATIDDIFIVFDVAMTGRERIENHETIAFTLTPRPDAKPRTREGGFMRHFNVRVWISEQDKEVVRLDAEAIDTLSFGLGVFARLHKGSQLSFLRRKINGEVWLPAEMRYEGSARVGMVWTLRRRGTSAYSGYRKYTVDTASEFSQVN